MTSPPSASRSSTGWATSAGCPAPRSWRWTGSTRTPPATRSPSCSADARRLGWWSRSTSGLGATRTSASCWCAAATSTPPSCPTTCPTSSARRCSTPGAGCRPRRGRSPGSSPSPAARPTCGRWRPSPPGSTPRTPGRSARPSTPVWSCSAVTGVWFRHPLLADVLTETYLPGEAAPVHAAWAAHLESVSTDGVDELRRLGDLAIPPRAGRRRLRGVRSPPPGRRPRREARRAARGRRPTGPRRRPVGGGCRPHRRGRPRTAARTRRPRLRLGRAEPREPPTARAARDLVSPDRDPLWASG